MTPFLAPDRRLRGGRESEEYFGGSTRAIADTEDEATGQFARHSQGSNILVYVAGWFLHTNRRSFSIPLRSARRFSLRSALESASQKDICIRLWGNEWDRAFGKETRRRWQGWQPGGEGEGASRQVRTELRGTIKSHFAPCPPPPLSSGRSISLTLHRSRQRKTTTTERLTTRSSPAKKEEYSLLGTFSQYPPSFFLINVVRGQGRSTPSRPLFGRQWFPSRWMIAGYNVIRPRLSAIGKKNSLQVSDCQQWRSAPNSERLDCDPVVITRRRRAPFQPAHSLSPAQSVYPPPEMWTWCWGVIGRSRTSLGYIVSHPLKQTWFSHHRRVFLILRWQTDHTAPWFESAHRVQTHRRWGHVDREREANSAGGGTKEKTDNAFYLLIYTV